MLFNAPTKEEKSQADFNRFLNRDSQGKFAVGNPGGPGRPKGSKDQFNEIRKDILMVWREMEGKERFAYFFSNPENFEKALHIIFAVCPKKWFLELVKDINSGQVAIKVEKKDE